MREDWIELPASRRREDGSDWSAVGQAVSDASGLIAYEDRSITAGQRYGYSLRVNGSTALVGETWIDVPLATQLSLRNLNPNPSSRGSLRVAISLVSDEPASLDLLDLSGRRMRSRSVGALGAGNHEVTLDRSGVPPGVYLLCLAQSGRSVSTKVVVAE